MKRIICILLTACMLLCLSACGGTDAPADETTESLAQTERTDPSRETAEAPMPTEEPEDPSLIMFRQAMAETPQIFAAAYLGYVPQDADPFSLMQEAAPQLCEDLPFLLTIPQDAVTGTFGYLFCIVPADENATVAVNRRPWNPQTESYEEAEVLYRSESGSPFLVMCPNEDRIPDTEVIITDSNGTVTVWSPLLDPDNRISGLLNESAESLIFDFTSYDELSDQGTNPGPDSAALAGIWDLVRTETEGDRNEAESGVCTIEIVADETGSFRFTYTSRDYPEENVQDRALTVIPGELYPGCSNDRWFAEAAAEGGDAVQYALTLLEDGMLLLQTYWETDGMPWVSYGWYQMVD